MEPDARTGTLSGHQSPLDAVEDMRATARWIIGAEAVVGAALLGAVPLAGIGKVHGSVSVTFALVGLLFGLAGVGWAIWHTAEALIPPVTTLASLHLPIQARFCSLLTGEWKLLEAPVDATIDRLHGREVFWGTVVTNLSIMRAAEQDEARQRVLDQALTDATTNEMQIRNYLRWIVELCHVWCVRRQVRRARLHTMIGGFVSVLGVVMILAATSQP